MLVPHIKLDDIESFEEIELNEVYDISVQDNTNYFLSTESSGEILVHNSTKTWSFFQLLFLYCISNRNKRVIILRETAIACRDLVEPEWQDWLRDPCGRLKQLEDGEITDDEYEAFISVENLFQYLTENKTRHRYTFTATGSQIVFSGADNINKIIGKKHDIVWCNEPYRFPEEVMLQLLKRVTTALLLDWNPDRDHYIERFRDRPDCITIHSTFMDNPFLDPEVKKELLGTKPLSNEYYDFEVEHYLKMGRSDVEADVTLNHSEHLADILMCWDNEKHSTANKFHWEVYGLGIKSERPNRIFRWKECPDQDYYDLKVPEYVITDWGKVDPWAIIKGKYHDGRLYIHELNYDSENIIRSRMTSTERAQIEGTDEGIVTWMFNKLGIEKSCDIIADTNRPLKMAILRRMGWTVHGANKGKGSIIDGIDLVENLEVYYTRSSINAAYEQENYSRKVDTNGVVLEEPEDIDNHICDCVRYLALYLQAIGIIRTI